MFLLLFSIDRRRVFRAVPRTRDGIIIYFVRCRVADVRQTESTRNVDENVNRQRERNNACKWIRSPWRRARACVYTSGWPPLVFARPTTSLLRGRRMITEGALRKHPYGARYQPIRAGQWFSTGAISPPGGWWRGATSVSLKEVICAFVSQASNLT